MDDLDGRVAVVTGAASGIGHALAARFAAEGMSVVLADVDGDRLATVIADISSKYAAPLLSVETDVSQWDSVVALADASRRRFGTVHVVCNNAGVIGQCAPMWDASPAEWHWVIGVNLWGVVFGLEAFLPLLLEQNEGHIVNTASAAAWQSAPGLGSYAATKHAVLAISEALLLELKGIESKVGVSVLCPTFVRTPIMQADRNWPAELGQRPMPPTGRTARVRHSISTAIDRGVSADVIASAVVSGIKSKQFLISDSPEVIIESAERRVDIARGLQPSFGRVTEGRNPSHTS